MHGKKVVQIVDAEKGLVIAPMESVAGSCLIYRDKIFKSSIDSFFEVMIDGTITHIDSELKVKGESNGIRCGLALALQPEDNGPPEVFRFDDHGGGLHWRHEGSKTLMQPGGNTIHVGARVLAMEDFTHVDNALVDVRFKLTQVPMSVLELEWQKKQMRDDKLAFENSSDGRLVMMRNKGIPTEAINANVQRTVGECDPATIEVGLNRLRIATTGNPVMNLSVRNTLSLHSTAEKDTEMWRLDVAHHIPGANSIPTGPNQVYGAAVTITNTTSGNKLAVNSNGQLCCSRSEDDKANAWTMLDAGESMLFLVNIEKQVALANLGGMICLEPAYECIDFKRIEWSVQQF